MWDSLAVTPMSAELIAAAAIALMDQHYPPSILTEVEVWQCFYQSPQQLNVTAAAARSAFAKAASFVAGM
jgi:hypothetical protein